MSALWANIPESIRQYPSWVGWRYINKDGKDKPTKVPYHLCSGRPASVNDPSTWCPWEEVANHGHNFDGVGFVLSDKDPFFFVDFDATTNAENLNTQLRIYNIIETYAERSPSGNGAHLIGIGKFAGRGRKTGDIELYCRQRFATFTGDILRNIDPQPTEHLATLYQQMTKHEDIPVYEPDGPERYSDTRVLEIANAAENAYKFNELWNGRWAEWYPSASQNEADYALINMLSFYTEHRGQTHRLFLASQLGQRPKARTHKTYVHNMITGSFDRLVPFSQIDWPALKAEWGLDQSGDAKAMEITSTPPESDTTQQETSALSERMDEIAKKFKYEPPASLLRDIADYIYSQAPRPVREIAIGGAISLMAGICGQAYNVSATGLNQYTLILAGTGTGKESANSGINKLIQAVSVKAPTAREFLGPSQIASQQALLKYLDKNSCFLSVIGEFGLQLQQMSGDHAKDHQSGLRTVMLKLYNMSGRSNDYQPMIYADPEKNTQTISAPNFSLLGESTPERFYQALSEDMIYEGFLPRFTIIEYRGGRPKPNRQHHLAKPSEKLVDNIASIAAGCKASMASKVVTEVGFSNDALATIYDFGEYVDSLQDETATEFTKSLWSRTDVKAMKMAALVAIGQNYTNPIINLEAIEWAIGMALHDIRSLERKFLDGEIGRASMSSVEQKQVDAVIRAISQWMHNPFDAYSKYGGTIEMHSAKMIVAENISKRVLSQAYFDKEKYGAGRALDTVFKTLIDWGYIEEADKSKIKEIFGHARKTFAIIDQDKFPASLGIKAAPGRKL